MTDFHEFSKLPKDRDYWTGLEQRIVGELRPLLRHPSRPSVEWWTPLAARAWGLGGLAVAAGLAALLVVPPRAVERQPSPAGLLRLPDNDPALAALLAGSDPPQIVSMLVVRWKENER